MNKKQLKAFGVGIAPFIWQLLFFVIPITVLILSCFFDENRLSFSKFTPFFHPSYTRSILASLLMAFFNALICMTLAFPLAYTLNFKIKKFKNILLFLILVPFWTNFLIHVYSWFYVLEKQGICNQFLLFTRLIQEPKSFLNTSFSILIMLVYYYLPLCLLPIYSGLERIDVKLIEASYDLGAGFFVTFQKIILPLCKVALRSGFFLVFIPTFGEFAIPELMGGDKFMFSGSVISHFLLGDGTALLGSAFALYSCAILMVACYIFYKLFDLALGKINES
jgi:spermidine/putrescine transport system permease protein